MADFQLDTSGVIVVPGGHPLSPRETSYYRWRDLSPFCQGYVEAMFEGLPQPDGHRPTDPMRRALEALVASGGRMHVADFYRAMGVTNRGRYLVYERMKDRHWVEPSPSDLSASIVSILPWGRTALRPLSFSDLSPSALALILKDCEAVQKRFGNWFFPNTASAGRFFWQERSRPNDPEDRFMQPLRDAFPPLLPSLDEEGKVQLTAVQQ